MSPAPAAAQQSDLRSLPESDATAHGHFQLGTRLYGEGDFAGAAREFEESYRLSQRPELLYNIFLAYRDAAELESAARALRAFLAATPESEQRPQLEARLARLEHQLAERAREQHAREEEDQARERDEAARGSNGERDAMDFSAESSRRTRSPARRLSLGLLAGGGGLLAAALGTGLRARSLHSGLEDACGVDRVCDPRREGDASRGRAFAVATDALWISGALASVAGLTLLLTVGRRDQREALETAAVCHGAGCTVTARLRF